MLKPVRWNTFVRDFVVIQVGFAIFGLSIAMMIRSHLGTTPWAVLEVALSQLTDIRPGRMSILVGAVVLVGALALREKIGWGTLSNILFIGLWEDMFLEFIPPVEDRLILQSVMLLSAILMTANAPDAIHLGSFRNKLAAISPTASCISTVITISGLCACSRWIRGASAR